MLTKKYHIFFQSIKFEPLEMSRNRKVELLSHSEGVKIEK